MCFSCAETKPGGIDAERVKIIREDSSIQCEFCDTWFHDTCLMHYKWLRISTEDERELDMFLQFNQAKYMVLNGLDLFRCPKCSHWLKFLRSKKAKVLLALPDDELQIKLSGEAWREEWNVPNKLLFIESHILE